MILRVSICATFRSFQVIIIVGVATNHCSTSSLSAVRTNNTELSQLAVVGLEHMTLGKFTI